MMITRQPKLALVAGLLITVFLHVVAAEARAQVPGVRLKKIGDTPIRENPDRLMFSADGKTLVIFTTAKASDFVMRSHGSFQVWDLKRGKARAISLKGSGPQSMSVSPDGKYVAVNGPSGIDIWDAQRGQAVRRMTLPAARGQKPIGASDAQYGTSGKWVTATHIDYPRVWNVKTGKAFPLKPALFPERTVSLASIHFAPKGNCLLIEVQNLTAAGRGRFPKSGVCAWSTKTAKPIGTFHLEQMSAGRLLVSEDGCTVVGNGRDRSSLLVWDLTQALQLKKPQEISIKPSRTIPLGNNKRAWPTGLALSPDGKMLAVGLLGSQGFGGIPAKGNKLKFIDVPTGKTLHELEFGQYMVGQLAFSPNGQLLAGAASISAGVGSFGAIKSGKVILWKITGAN